MIKIHSLIIIFVLLLASCSMIDNRQQPSDIQVPPEVNKYETTDIYVKSVRDKISKEIFTGKERDISNVAVEGVFAFGILKNGNLHSISVVKSTGSRDSDSELIAKIKSAAPFLPPPASVIGAAEFLDIRLKIALPKSE